MPIKVVERVRCLACNQNASVTRIPAAVAPPTGGSMPDYQCDECGRRAVIFWIDDIAYLGLGLETEFFRITGLLPAGPRTAS